MIWTKKFLISRYVIFDETKFPYVSDSHNLHARSDNFIAQFDSGQTYVGSSKIPQDLGSSARGSTNQTSPEQQLSWPRPGQPIRGPLSIPSSADAASPDDNPSLRGPATFSPVPSPNPPACGPIESSSPGSHVHPPTRPRLIWMLVLVQQKTPTLPNAFYPRIQLPRLFLNEVQDKKQLQFCFEIMIVISFALPQTYPIFLQLCPLLRLSQVCPCTLYLHL